MFDGHNGPDVSVWVGHHIGEYFEKLMKDEVDPAEALKLVCGSTNEVETRKRGREAERKREIDDPQS